MVILPSVLHNKELFIQVVICGAYKPYSERAEWDFSPFMGVSESCWTLK